MLKKIHAYIIDELMLLPILIVNWSLWAVSGYHKLVEILTDTAWVEPNGWVPWLKAHFKGTFLDQFVTPLFYFLTALECLAGLFLTIALLRLEFFHSKEKDFFKIGLFFSAISIACMSLGQNLANADEDVFELASYLTTTMLSYFFLMLHSHNLLTKKMHLP